MMKVVNCLLHDGAVVVTKPGHKDWDGDGEDLELEKFGCEHHFNDYSRES